MIWLLRHWKAAIALVLAAALWGHGYYTARLGGLYALQVERTRAEQTIAEMAKAEADAQAKARRAEQGKATAQAAIAGEYERGKQDAQVAADRVIADLRSGAVQLRNRWQGCLATDRVSGTAASAAESDAAAADRAASASRIVRAAVEADAQIKALQRIVAEDRQ